MEPTRCGATARSVMPAFSRAAPWPAAGQRVSGMGAGAPRLSACASGPRRRTDAYFPSLSSRRTLVYKGMLTTDPAGTKLFADLGRRADRPPPWLFVHSRFSTNTFPRLALAHPLPVHRPQRRDQHGDGQPQLDARPRGAARLGPHPRRPGPDLPDLHARRLDSASFDEVLKYSRASAASRARRTGC